MKTTILTKTPAVPGTEVHQLWVTLADGTIEDRGLYTQYDAAERDGLWAVSEEHETSYKVATRKLR
jgi:hypothetical protein